MGYELSFCKDYFITGLFFGIVSQPLLLLHWVLWVGTAGRGCGQRTDLQATSGRAVETAQLNWVMYGGGVRRRGISRGALWGLCHFFFGFYY